MQCARSSKCPACPVDLLTERCEGQEVDDDGGGEIDFDEFCTFMGVQGEAEEEGLGGEADGFEGSADEGAALAPVRTGSAGSEGRERDKREAGRYGGVGSVKGNGTRSKDDDAGGNEAQDEQRVAAGDAAGPSDQPREAASAGDGEDERQGDSASQDVASLAEDAEPKSAQEDEGTRPEEVFADGAGRERNDFDEAVAEEI